MSRDSKMCAAQFAKGMGIGLGVGMAVGAAAGLMMQPQKKRCPACRPCGRRFGMPPAVC